VGRRLAASSCLAVALVAGCASDSSLGEDTGGADAAPPDLVPGADVAPPDVAPGADAALMRDLASAPDGPAADVAPTSGRGVVTVREEGAETVAEARFFEAVPDPPPVMGCGCQELDWQGCRIRSCGIGPGCSWQPAPPPPRSFGAGTLTINRPGGAALIVPSPPTGGYGPVRAAGKLGTAGALVTVDGAGGIVPVFHAAVPIPEPLELTDPAWPSVVSGQAVRVRWRPAPTGQVEVEMTWVFKPDMHWTESTTTCAAPAAAGELVVPPSAFPVQQVSVRLRRLSRALVDAGAFAVTTEVVLSDIKRDVPVLSSAGGVDGGP
jgi:hypothetical protein